MCFFMYRIVRQQSEGFFSVYQKKKKNTNVKKEKEVTKYLSVHEETFDGTHQLTDKTRTSIKVSPSLRSFRFRRRVPATPQTENKASSLGEHPRKFGNAFSCTGSFVNSPKISISSSPNGCRNAKARSIRPLQPKRPVWTGTTRETGGHHHASCFWRRTQRKEDHAMRSPSGCLPPCSLHVRYNHSNQTIGVDIKVLSSSALASCYNDA